ncbi:MAG: sensor histidine kinase [Tranquillimonas sp.]
MVPGGRGFGRLDRLDFRLVLMLGVALLPIGLIAVAQTYRLINEANARIEAALLGDTMDAAAGEREIIVGTLASARNVALVAEAIIGDPAACSRLLTRLVQRNDALSFAGIVSLEGIVTCGSADVGADRSQSQGYQDFMRNMVESVTAVGRGAAEHSVIVIREPLSRGDTMIGYLAMTLPHAALSLAPEQISRSAPQDIITFNTDGEILTSQRDLMNVEMRLPQNRALAALKLNEPVLFRDVDRNGEEHVYTVAPLLRNRVYVLAIWSPARIGTAVLDAGTAVVFPLLMWIASLSVAYFAVHSLVIRHIRSLRHRIRVFSSTRRLLPEPKLDDMPAELREVTEAFLSMADRIIRDEADLENNLHEKDVLLREVHHRVKNNLQLIASITNMQIRKSKDPETKFILRRLQDRVMGLAAIHRALYQATALSKVRADHLLDGIGKQLAISSNSSAAGIRTEIETEPVTLYPDQAVPLALLLTEAATNAMKYIGKPVEGPPWIRIAMCNEENGTVTLTVANSLGTPLVDEGSRPSTGLGSQLMAAFTLQLGADFDAQMTDTSYRVTANFRPSDFSSDMPEG